MARERGASPWARAPEKAGTGGSAGTPSSLQRGSGRAWAIVLVSVLIQWIIFDLSADTWFNVRLAAVVLVLYSFVVTMSIKSLEDQKGKYNQLTK